MSGTLGTIEWADQEWDVVAFTGLRDGVSMTIGPSADQTPEWVVAKWLADVQSVPEAAEFRLDASDLLCWLRDRGYAIVATRLTDLGVPL